MTRRGIHALMIILVTTTHVGLHRPWTSVFRRRATRHHHGVAVTVAVAIKMLKFVRSSSHWGLLAHVHATVMAWVAVVSTLVVVHVVVVVVIVEAIVVVALLHHHVVFWVVRSRPHHLHGVVVVVVLYLMALLLHRVPIVTVRDHSRLVLRRRWWFLGLGCGVWVLFIGLLSILRYVTHLSRIMFDLIIWFGVLILMNNLRSKWWKKLILHLRFRLWCFAIIGSLFWRTISQHVEKWEGPPTGHTCDHIFHASLIRALKSKAKTKHIHVH